MQLLIYIGTPSQAFNRLLTALMDGGIGGATLVDCQGLLQAVSDAPVEPPRMFGSLRQFIHPDHPERKMLLAVLQEDQVETAREIIHRECGSLAAPDTGILFTLPITFAEGVPGKLAKTV